MVRAHYFVSSLLLGSLLSACTPSSFEVLAPANSPPSLSIIGGTEMDASDSLSLSVVAVYDSLEGQLCSGTLINRNVVLTAAHCVGQDWRRMYIIFGQNLDNNAIYAQVDKLEVSPYWSPTADQNMGDIALLHFQGPLPAPHKPAVLLPAFMAEEAIKNDTLVVVAGYGVTDAETVGGHTLRKAQVRVSDADFTKSEVLVDQSNGQGVCHGDSGGPAFVEVDGTYYLWGVTSRGVNDPGRSCSTSAAFTSTTYHSNWIHRMKDKLSSSLINFLWQDE